MSFGDKFENAKDQAVGKAKEAFGDATNNDEKKAEGEGQQAKGKFGEAAENVKDAFK